jgi:hypothetical protein
MDGSFTFKLLKLFSLAFALKYFHFWAINFHIGQLMGKLGLRNPSRKGVMHTRPGPGGVCKT